MAKQMDKPQMEDVVGSSTAKTTRGSSSKKSNRNRGSKSRSRSASKSNNRSEAQGGSNYPGSKSGKTGIDSSVPGRLSSSVLDDIRSNKASAGNIYRAPAVGDEFKLPPMKHGYGTPGLEVIYYTPTFGFNNNAASKIQSTADRLFQDVQAYMTQRLDFGSTDLMIYIIGLSQLFAWNATLCRIVNIMGFSSFSTQYALRGYVRALGFDYDDLVDHQTQLMEHIRNIRIELAEFALPPCADYAARHEMLNSNVYMDENNTNAQMYAFVPRTYLKLTEVNQGGLDTYALVEIDNPQTTTDTDEYQNKGLVHMKWDFGTPTSTEPIVYVKRVVTPTLLTYADIKNITDQLLIPWKMNADMKLIRSAICKAYAGTYRTLPVYENPGLWTPIFDESMLPQIENMTLIGHLDPSSTTLKEDASGTILISNPWLNYLLGSEDATNKFGDRSGLEGSKPVNLHGVLPEGEISVLATKFTNSVERMKPILSPNTDKDCVVTARTEIAEFAMIWVTDYANSTSLNSLYVHTEPIYYMEQTAFKGSNTVTLSNTLKVNDIYTKMVPYFKQWLQKHAWTRAFKHHSAFINAFNAQYMNGNDDVAISSGMILNWDLDTYATVDRDQLLQMAQNDLTDMFFPK